MLTVTPHSGSSRNLPRLQKATTSRIKRRRKNHAHLEHSGSNEVASTAERKLPKRSSNNHCLPKEHHSNGRSRNERSFMQASHIVESSDQIRYLHVRSDHICHVRSDQICQIVRSNMTDQIRSDQIGQIRSDTSDRQIRYVRFKIWCPLHMHESLHIPYSDTQRVPCLRAQARAHVTPIPLDIDPMSFLHVMRRRVRHGNRSRNRSSVSSTKTIVNRHIFQELLE